MHVSGKPFKIAIVGAAGSVGATVAFAAILKLSGLEILVVDANVQGAVGNADDMIDAAYGSTNVVRSGTLQDAGQADCIIITAGARSLADETRAALLGRNVAIMKSICAGLAPLRKDAKVLVVANPVDVLSHVVRNLLDLPHNQVFGSGCLLDSIRLRNYIASLAQVDPRDVDAMVIGEHGDRQFAVWSIARIGGAPLLNNACLKDISTKDIEDETRRKAYSIIENKGATNYGIGMTTVTILEAVINNTNHIMPVAHYLEEYGTYVSYPGILNANGASTTTHLVLTEEETRKLKLAAEATKAMVDEAMALVG